MVLFGFFALAMNVKAANPIYSDDFEDGNLTGLITYGVTSSTEQAHGGSRSAKCDHSISIVNLRKSFTAVTEIYAEWWIYTATTWNDTIITMG